MKKNLLFLIRGNQNFCLTGWLSESQSRGGLGKFSGLTLPCKTNINLYGMRYISKDRVKPVISDKTESFNQKNVYSPKPLIQADKSG